MDDFVLIKWWFTKRPRNDAQSLIHMQIDGARRIFAVNNHSDHNPLTPDETIRYQLLHGGIHVNEFNKWSVFNR